MEKFKTYEEAARYWVREFNSFPSDMLKIVIDNDFGIWRSVRPVRPGDSVEMISYNNGKGSCKREVVEVENVIRKRGKTILTVTLTLFDKDEKVNLYDDDWIWVEYPPILPMWGTLWQFGDSLDNEWLEERGGLEAMADCGFEIYHHEDFGYFFGIDGAGYDFYEAHWIPLYKKRGLKWHDPALDENE